MTGAIKAALDGVESFLDEIHEVTGGNFTDRYEWSRRAAESIEKLAAARIDYAALLAKRDGLMKLVQRAVDDRIDDEWLKQARAKVQL